MMFQDFQCSAVNSTLWQILVVSEAKLILEKSFETLDCYLVVVLLLPVEVLV